MRSLVTALLLLLSATQLMAAQTAKLSGKITNQLADEVIFSYYSSTLDYSQKEFKAKLSPTGEFSIAIPLTQQFTQLDIQNGDQGTEIFIQPGDDIKITLDGKRFDSSLVYSGKGAPIADFMAKHLLQYNRMVMYAMTIQPLYAKSEAEFIAGSNEAMQKQIDFLEANKKDIPADFIKYWKDWHQYTTWSNMLRYGPMHKMMLNGGKPAKLTKEDYKIALQVPAAFNDAYVEMSPYAMYVSDIYDYQYRANTDVDSNLPEPMKVVNRSIETDKQAKTNMPPKTREFYFARRMYSNMKYTPLNIVESQYKEFKKDYKTSVYDNILTTALDIKRKLAGGQPAIDFTFTTLEGKSAKLSDYKGKVVYMDFWASWCGPCMRELPSARKVEEHFKDKDVVFLNISIDDDVEAWKNSITKNNIEGIHTRGDGGWKSPIAALYGIQGVPSYFLVDKNGKFVTDETPRPSDTDKLTAMIEQALR